MLKKLVLIIIILSLAIKAEVRQQMESNSDRIISKGYILYLSNTLIVKLKPLNNLNHEKTINELVSFIESKNIKVSLAEKLFKTNKSLNKTPYNLSNIYLINYNADIDPFELIKRVGKNEAIEYIEPKFVYKTDIIPNDPRFSEQYFLNKILAPSAWDISKGDSAIVIGIIDTGIYWTHPDLNPNIWINKNEIPNNGIDDDQNGYIDDYRGWDFGGLKGVPDNNPEEDAPDHGTHVAGLASAATNNGIGIASAGYKCKIMAVKTSQNDRRDSSSGAPYIVYGYEGIKYAADNGAKVINCSWGGGGYSNLGQDIINYAAAKGSLVVAAAGNGNTSNSHYPSYYKNVLAVTATDSSDLRAAYSNYNYNVDVSAPGNIILSTWGTSIYISLNGTSLSSPITAGVAGLVFAAFPNYTPEQVAEKIRVSSDDIYSKNSGYRYKLGKGRVNAFRAVSNTDNISVRINSFILDDAAPLGNGNGILEPNESAKIICTFKNILAPVTNVALNLTSLTNGITVTQGSVSTGAMNTGGEFTNTVNPFIISSSADLGQDLSATLLISFNEGNYSDFQAITFTCNPTFVAVNNEKLEVTIGSLGNLGFNDYPGNKQGQGFRYKQGTNLMFEGALIIGTGPNKISDRARDNSALGQNKDFQLVSPIKVKIPGTNSDIQTTSEFNDNGAGSSKIGVKIVLNTYSFYNVPNNDFIILQYHFINQSGSNISNFHAGLFFDWDLIEGSGIDDYSNWDNAGNFGYVFNVTRKVKTYTGCGVLNHSNYNFRSILNAGGDGGWGIYDGFSDDEKWQALSGGLTKLTAGAEDVSHLVGAGPFEIKQNDTLTVAFALMAGDTLTELRNSISVAKEKYKEIIKTTEPNKDKVFTFYLGRNYPNPFNQGTKIDFTVPGSIINGLSEAVEVKLEIFDILGRKVVTLMRENLKPGEYTANVQTGNYFSSGVYYYRLTASGVTETKKMLFIK